MIEAAGLSLYSVARQAGRYLVGTGRALCLSPTDGDYFPAPRALQVSAGRCRGEYVLAGNTTTHMILNAVTLPATSCGGSVFDNIGLGPNDVVLDLGCGDGRWVVAAALRGCTGRGLDLNEDLLQKGHDAAAGARVSSYSLLLLLFHASNSFPKTVRCCYYIEVDTYRNVADLQNTNIIKYQAKTFSLTTVRH